MSETLLTHAVLGVFITGVHKTVNEKLVAIGVDDTQNAVLNG